MFSSKDKTEIGNLKSNEEKFDQEQILNNKNRKTLHSLA